MSLKNITIIVLRLFSLSWLVNGIGLLASSVATMTSVPSNQTNYSIYAAPAVMIIFAIGLFLLSQPIARLVTPPPNEKLSLGGLSLYDLYCFAFTFLGLYFVLSSVGDTLNWMHYYFVVKHYYNGNAPEQFTSLYKLSRSLITLIAGGIVLIFAPRCGRKLTELQRRHDQI